MNIVSMYHKYIYLTNIYHKKGLVLCFHPQAYHQLCPGGSGRGRQVKPINNSNNESINQSFNQSINQSINQSRVLVHGCDGFDQSAAVVVAALMRHFTATLEVSLIEKCHMHIIVAL